MAEREGFEPPEGRPSTVFKTAAFVRSATSPLGLVDIDAGQFVDCQILFDTSINLSNVKNSIQGNQDCNLAIPGCEPDIKPAAPIANAYCTDIPDQYRRWTKSQRHIRTLRIGDPTPYS